MWGSFSSWLAAPKLNDPIRRRQAPMAQVTILVVLAACLLALPVAFSGDMSMVLFDLLAIGTLGAGSLIALVLLRRGWFDISVGLTIAALVAALGNFLVRDTIAENANVILLAALPIALAGLLLSRRVLIICAVLVAGLLAAVVLAEPLRFGPNAGAKPQDVAIITLIIAALTLFLDRFGSVLRESLHDTMARERELEALKESLEGAVAARTAELQATVDQLQASQATIRELGAPVLPVLPGVLVAPLVGAIDSARAADLSAAVLSAVDRTRARQVILDITGVAVVDTHVARALVRVAQASRLLGAEALLVGVSAEVAQTMVTLGVDLEAIRVYPNLQEAVGALHSVKRKA